MTELLTDDLWTTIQPLLPTHPRSAKGGRPRADNRRCLAGILYVLRGGIAWRLLPDEYPSPATCWRRLREWTAAAVWPQLRQALLQALEKVGGLDWSRAVIDSANVRAVFGGSTPALIPRIGPSPAASGIC